ncbi:DNA-processing protein DprA [Nocardia sp. CDC159]|uniref:DNA-processing protein DprA n=1 Tax=Nocardia pulmonis TaxID=2951408 RepID=A0A9X2EA09_9NOCA|nr:MULTISPECIES: DNA-processing protein DprA [Nocardia]MCM6774526.1 DNA-processing protein DprA [Nocardia pulmonis]MCM6787408.1 DNA-processing protein DprA [Nocardia sp. CDC159]
MNSAAPEPVLDHERRLRAWALLSRASLDVPHSVHHALTTQDVVEAAARIASRSGDFRAARDAWAQADHDLAHIDGVGGRLLTRDDDSWPGRLADLDTLAPDAFAPVALWTRGQHRLDAYSAYTVAVVGARAATDYGIHVAADLAGELTTRGWNVVSGGAFGVDAAAHAAALRCGRPTVAVLPCGLDRLYPSQNADLFTRILDNGLIVSEYPPGEPARRDRFIHRNRLTVALSTGVVVCEAGLRSGTLNTARWAYQLGRPVAAVPGSIYSAASRGCHQLIRDGHARLATSTEDVLNILTHRAGTEPAH